MAEKALSAATDARKETASMTELANKKLKERSLKTKSNLSHIQRLELARSENIVIAKGIPPCTSGKETHEELRRVVDMAFQSTGARGITVTYIRRLQRVRGDNGSAPAALRISLSNLTDKLILFDAVKRRIESGGSVPYSFQNEIPKYALGMHKQLSKIAAEIRRMDNNVKTRVNMSKGDHWPSLAIKRRGETAYKPAPQGLIDTAKKTLNEAKKIAKAERQAAAPPAANSQNDDDDLLLEDMDMGVDEPPQPSGPAARAGMNRH